MGEVICPFCKSGLDEPGVRCTQCGTRHHRVCWLEYGGRCSVFSCYGRLPITRNAKSGNILLALWCLLNYGLHLILRFVGQLTGPVPLQDIFLVLLIEGLVIGTGCVAIRMRSNEPLKVLGLLLFAGNGLFLSFLFSHYAAYGFESLNALIRL